MNRIQTFIDQPYGAHQSVQYNLFTEEDLHVLVGTLSE